MSVGWGQDCIDSVEVELWGECYNIEETIYLDLSYSGLTGEIPPEISYLINLEGLCLGNNELTSVPDSIGLLKNLNNLDLRENKITSLPEEICNIYPHYTNLNLSGNQICPPYPYCFDYLSDQDKIGCDSIGCLSGYLEISGECYNENHIMVLQDIIDNNSSLNGMTPLDLGKAIGYQKWKDGKLIHLNLVSNQLETLPDSLSAR